MSTNKQEDLDVPMSCEITNAVCTNNTQVISSEGIVVEDSAGNDVART